jgi:hypothetical protein
MRNVLKYLSFLFFVLFLWAAFVQLNDPDAGMWIGIYLVAAMGTLLNGLGRLPKGISLGLAIAFGGLAVAFWPDAFEGVTIGGGDIDNIERGRESLGMAITALLFLLLGVFSQKKAAP